MFIERLGPYQIRRRIGRGGMGTVYEGVDVETGLPAAIKLLPSHMAQQPGFRERFEAEIETLRKLNHPNIVRLFGFGEQDGQLFYAMEYVAGSSLEEQLNRGRSFNWHEVTQIGIQTCRALRHAHDRGVIHRDIKPGNLLAADDGHVKLSDFGIARLFGNVRLTGAGGIMGTAEYMAPEQAEGRPVDPRTDLYSLGGLLYVLLARRPLFQGKSFGEILEKQRFAQPEPLRQFAPDIPVELDQIIHQLLEKDSDRRIPNAMLLARRLEAMEHALAVEPESKAEDGNTEGAMAGVLPPPVPRALSLDDLPETKITTAFAPPVVSTPSEPAKPASRFVPVTPDDLDRPENQWSSAAWISPQTWTLIIGLIVVGLTAWYLLQPASADALYRRIEAQTQIQTGESFLQAEDEIREFLMRFSGDPRCEELREHAREIELARLERKLELRAKGLVAAGTLLPIERDYLEALNYAWLDPELGMARFKAMIDLYGSRSEPASPTAQCLEIARRRLAQLREQRDMQAGEHLALVQERLDRADRIRQTDPARAAAMCQAVVELYEHKPWAADAVARARAALAPRPPRAPSKGK